MRHMQLPGFLHQLLAWDRCGAEQNFYPSNAKCLSNGICMAKWADIAQFVKGRKSVEV